MPGFNDDTQSTVDQMRVECGLGEPVQPFTVRIGSMSVTSVAAPGRPMYACDASYSLMSQLGPLLGSLQPIFCLIEGVMSIHGIVSELTSLAQVPPAAPDLEKIGEDAEKLAKSVACIAQLHPVLVVPNLILDLFKFVLVHLVCLRDQARALLNVVESANAMREAAEELSTDEAAKVLATAACHEQNVDLLSAQLALALGAVRFALEMMNSFGDMIGIQIIPEAVMEALDGGGEAALDGIVGVLNTVIDAILDANDVLPDIIPREDLTWARDPEA